MKKLIPALVVVVIVVFVGSWLGLSFQTKAKYDNLRKELSKYPVTVSPMDNRTNELLLEIESKWTCKLNETNGPHSFALKGLGLTPSVKNVAYLISFQMPEYSWLSQESNKEATKFAMIKGEMSPKVTDKTIHISANEKTAFVIIKDNIVLVFRDEANGMREMVYSKNK